MPEFRLSHLRAAAAFMGTTLLGGSALAQDTAAPSDISDPTVQSAITDWQVCNETSFVLRKASAFIRNGRMVAQGWDQLLPGACQTVPTPRGSPRYLYAESLDIHQGGIREWKGKTPLCVDNEDFISDATQVCLADGLQTRNYFAVRPDEPVTSLVEPSDYGLSKALSAGKQRLLRDAGYDVSRIDGVSGRRTARTLRTFRSDAELPSNIEDEALLNALIDAARTHKASIGLEICNDSSNMIWAATAMRDGAQWRSRGWWQAAPGACTRPINQSLQGTDAHVFALQESPGNPDLRLRTVATSPAQYCIGEAKFDALGNEMCVEKGYAVAAFRPVPTEDVGARMRLTDADFAAPLPGGLRR